MQILLYIIEFCSFILYTLFSVYNFYSEINYRRVVCCTGSVRYFFRDIDHFPSIHSNISVFAALFHLHKKANKLDQTIVSTQQGRCLEDFSAQFPTSNRKRRRLGQRLRVLPAFRRICSSTKRLQSEQDVFCSNLQLGTSKARPNHHSKS